MPADGSIRQRGPTSWELRVYIGKGRRLYRTVHGNKTAARRALRDWLTDLDQAGTPGPDVTVAELLRRWQAARSADWTPKTRDETARFATRLGKLLGDVTLPALTPETIDTAYATLRADGLAASSVRRHHDTLHAALAQAVRWEWLARNPADGMGPKVKRRQVDTPTDADLDRLLAEVRRTPYGDSFWVFLLLAAELGWRRGELCALRWSDVDLDAGTVRARRRISAGQEVPGTKGGGDRPAIALSPDTLAAVKAHRVRCAETALACGGTLAPRSFVFSHEPGGAKPWRPDGVTQRFIRTRNRIGLGHVRLHDLRHYVATTLLAEGVDVGTVADRLGHTLASTTLNIYRAHVPAADQRAAQILGQRRKPGSYTEALLDTFLPARDDNK